jgi:chromosome segregation ATPase
MGDGMIEAPKTLDEAKQVLEGREIDFGAHSAISFIIKECERLRGELAESRALHEATKETVRLSVERIAELEGELEGEKSFCLAIKADYDAWLKLRDELADNAYDWSETTKALKARIAELEAQLDQDSRHSMSDEERKLFDAMIDRVEQKRHIPR